jgi:hypothetical protein
MAVMRRSLYMRQRMEDDLYVVMDAAFSHGF